MSRKRKRGLQVLNIAALVVTLVVNALANYLPLFGRTTGEVADALPNLFVPAGLTFSIWGVIYLLLVMFVIWQARDLFSREEEEMPFLGQLGPWFALASLGNVSWLFVYHAGLIVLSLVPMALLFASLLVAYRRMRIGRAPARLGDRLAVHLPFSVYIGWVSIAVIANVAVALVAIGWQGEPLPEAFWAILMIAVGAALGVLMLARRGDLFFALVVIWAYIGIIIARLQADDATSVAVAAGAAVAVLVAAILLLLPRNGIYRSRVLQRTPVGGTLRFVACSKAYANSRSRGSLQAPPVKLTP